MKKIFFALVCLFMLTYPGIAQPKETNDRWSINAGPVVAFPVRYLHLFHSFGIGADVAATHSINNGNWSAGGRANYTYFFGKSTNMSYGNTGSHYDAVHLFNVLAELNYLFNNRMIAGVDLGLGADITSGTTNATFARIAYLAYQMHMAHAIIIALFFDQTNLQKHIGLRASFQL